MTISSLSSGSIFTPNHYSGRAYPVTRVTIHEMAAVWTAQRCGEWFNQIDSASSNYGIGYDGTIMCYVDEDNAAWTSANWDNDNRAITIEVSNSYMGGDWPISDAAYNSLVRLCADICNRYGIWPEYNGTPNASFTEHKMFANTACPGPYIHNLLASGKIIKDIREKIGDDDIVTEQDKKDIARYCAEYVWVGENDQTRNMYNVSHWAYDEVKEINQKLDNLTKKFAFDVWNYRNTKLEKGDAYKILREIRDRVNAINKRFEATEKKL